MDDLEARIDDLYAGPLDAFIRARNALAKERATQGDADGAARVRSLRKPVVAAWALNRLAHEEPQAVGDLADLGERLRAAQRRALSGGGVEPLRAAIEERRRAVTDLVRAASRILEAAGVGAAPHRDDLTSTLEAAAADEEAAALLRSGRVVRPLRPPSAFTERGLRVLQGDGTPQRPSKGPPSENEADGEAAEQARAREARELERALTTAERRERTAATAVERARRRLSQLEGRRADAREALKAAEAEHRGATVELKRLSSRLEKARRAD